MSDVGFRSAAATFAFTTVDARRPLRPLNLANSSTADAPKMPTKDIPISPVFMMFPLQCCRLDSICG